MKYRKSRNNESGWSKYRVDVMVTEKTPQVILKFPKIMNNWDKESWFKNCVGLPWRFTVWLKFCLRAGSVGLIPDWGPITSGK